MVLDPHQGGGGGGVLSHLQKALERICRLTIPVEGVQMCWFGEGKYALFLVNVDAVPSLRSATSDIDNLFSRFIQRAHSRRSGVECREMSEIKWHSVGDMMGSRAVVALSEFCSKVFHDSTFQEWLVARDDMFWGGNGNTSSARHAGSSNGIPSSPVRAAASQRPQSAPRSAPGSIGSSEYSGRDRARGRGGYGAGGSGSGVPARHGAHMSSTTSAHGPFSHSNTRHTAGATGGSGTGSRSNLTSRNGSLVQGSGRPSSAPRARGPSGGVSAPYSASDVVAARRGTPKTHSMTTGSKYRNY